MQKFKDMLWTEKCPFGEMSQWGNVQLESVLWGSVRLGNCPFGEMSVGEVSVGHLSSGKCQLGKCPVRKLSYSLRTLPTNLVSWYIITSFGHACYISEYIYLHIFSVNFLLKRHLSRGHRISCPAHYLERTDNKPFSRLIGPTHINKESNCPLKLVGEMLLSHSAIQRKHLNTILYVTATVFKPTIICQTGQMIDLRCEYLSVRYSVKLQIWRLFRGGRFLKFRELILKLYVRIWIFTKIFCI